LRVEGRFHSSRRKKEERKKLGSVRERSLVRKEEENLKGETGPQSLGKEEVGDLLNFFVWLTSLRGDKRKRKTEEEEKASGGETPSLG